MKRWVILVLVWVLGAPAILAQEEMEGGVCAVPPGIARSFGEFHPQAEEVYWESRDNEYRASFFENGVSREIRFAASGQWISLCTYLEMSDLPQNIRDQLVKRFPEWEMPSVLIRAETPNQPPCYRVCYDLSNGFLELVFDQQGKLTEERLESNQAKEE